MGAKQLYVFVLSILLLIAGCSATAGPSSKSAQGPSSVSYDQFKNRFSEFKQRFSPSGFMNISPQELAIRTTSFPNQKIDNKRIDALNDDVRFPTRYEVYYKSKSSNVLAKVNFIFMPGNEVSSFLTINSIDQLENPNIVEQYADLKRPLFDEYIITQPGCLIVLNFVDLSNEDDDYGKKHRAFIEETTKFYSEFEAVLLEVNHTGR